MGFQLGFSNKYTAHTGGVQWSLPVWEACVFEFGGVYALPNLQNHGLGATLPVVHGPRHHGSSHGDGSGDASEDLSRAQS